MFCNKKDLYSTLVLESPNNKEDDSKTLLKRAFLASSVLVAFNLSLFLNDLQTSAHTQATANKSLPIIEPSISENFSHSSIKYVKKNPSELIIAVIDDGFFLDNKFFKDRLIQLPVSKSAYKYTYNTSSKFDEEITNHGTLVTSKVIIELNKYKDNEDIKIMPIDIDLCGGIVNSIKYAVDNGAKIINVSMNFHSVSQQFYNQIQSAINYANSKNVIIFATTGNNGPSISDSYLSVCDYVIAVGAKDADFSNRGEFVDFSGKGVAVKVVDQDGKETFSDGTSFVAPYYTATAAQLINLLHKSNSSIDIDSINHNQIIQIMAKSINPSLKRDFQNGWGEFSLKNLRDFSLPDKKNIEPPNLMLFRTSSNYYKDTLKLSFKVDGFGKIDSSNATFFIEGTTFDNKEVKKFDIEFSQYDKTFSSEVSLPDGHYTLKVDGIIDSDGNILQTQRDFIKDSLPVNCDITYVTANNSDKTNCVLLKGQVSDFSGVSSIEIYNSNEENLLDSFDYKNLSKLNLVSEFSTLIDSKKISDGVNIITIKAADSVGNVVKINYKFVKSDNKIVSIDYISKEVQIK